MLTGLMFHGRRGSPPPPIRFAGERRARTGVSTAFGCANVSASWGLLGAPALRAKALA